MVGTPKTKRGTRLVPIDAQSVAMLRRHREGQDVERVAWGPAWNDAGLVFTRENGLPLRPEYATRHFQAPPRLQACQPSGSTTCATPTPAWPSRPGST